MPAKQRKRLRTDPRLPIRISGNRDHESPYVSILDMHIRRHARGATFLVPLEGGRELHHLFAVDLRVDTPMQSALHASARDTPGT